MRWLLAAVVVAVTSAALRADPPVTIEAAVQTLQRGANLVIAGEPICAAHPLPAFYTRRNFAPAWSGADQVMLIDVIRHAADDGLDPADYHLAGIESLLPDAARRGELDLLLTDAFFLLSSHLQSGRTDPITIEPTWCLEPRTSDLVPALETALEIHEVRGAIAAFRPSHESYRQLREQLARYRGMTPWEPVAPGPSLRTGDSGPRVAQLIARLVASGDLEPGHPTFDAAVKAALKHFQHLHGLEDDGVGGQRTIRELNVPLADRIRQIEINLERWRWLPARLGDRHAIINLPEFNLTVVENEWPVLSMRIVVGKDFTHRTPVFSSEITQVVFNPYWNVPDSIADRELWPEQRRDPGYFAREHIEVLAGGRLRQKPGPWNALGSIKFNIPNRYTVYLHDTPSRELFSRAVRTFSHGCMRVEKPVDLALYVLRDNPGWTKERIIEQSKTGVERAIDLRSPLTVHVLYWTAYVDGGEVHFAPDIYARDPALDAAMRKRAPRF